MESSDPKIKTTVCRIQRLGLGRYLFAIFMSQPKYINENEAVRDSYLEPFLQANGSNLEELTTGWDLKRNSVAV